MKQTLFLVLLIVTFSFQNALAQDDIPSPKPNQVYPVGARLKAVCKLADAAHKVSTWTNFQQWDPPTASFGGINTSFSPVVELKTCSALFTAPGKYRMVVITGRWHRDEGHEIVAEFTIGQPTECNARSNQIIVVKDGNGKVLTDAERKAVGLEKDSFMSGQMVSVPSDFPKGIEIKFFDDSITRISSGSKLKIHSCSDLAPLEESTSVKLTLLLGKIWAKIAPDADLKWVIQSERAVAGNRGTTFSTEYDPLTKTTTVVVEEGSAWLMNRLGKIKTITINEGETGTQTMNQPPVLKKN